jgi:hypothetical protein
MKFVRKGLMSVEEGRVELWRFELVLMWILSHDFTNEESISLHIWRGALRIARHRDKGSPLEDSS